MAASTTPALKKPARRRPGAHSPPRPNVIAAIDIGTNSIRLEVVRIEPDHSIATLGQQKEMVRLGEDEFASDLLTPAAIERGALVCARFADVARGYQADEIIAFATSAVREADNRDEFIERVRKEADIEVRVISGPEEARLIYLGMASGADLGDRKALFMDIGGGSTELILGDANNAHLMESLKLGSIRLAGRFLEGDSGPISPERFQKMKSYVRAMSTTTSRRIAQNGFDVVYGGAGTISNLAGITARRMGDAPSSIRNFVVKTDDLRDTVQILCKMTLEERRVVPGMNPARADIILGGAAVLITILEDIRADRLTVSDLGLRRGIVIDRLLREHETRQALANTPLRLRSILQLARSCNFDEEHARHVVMLAQDLFDQLREQGLHRYGARERELLEYAALVHDIGCFLSHSGHQRHAYYLVRYSDLLGFNDTDISIIANIAYYHRKNFPKRKHDNLRDFDRAGIRLIATLSAIVRIAEGLDRSHLGLVRGLKATRLSKPNRVLLTLYSDSSCELEVWGAETNADLFVEVFGRPIGFQVAVMPETAVAAGNISKADGSEGSNGLRTPVLRG